MQTDDRIVVGVDDYPSSLAAVDLAMREAAAHQRPVHLVHADPWADHPGWRDQQSPGGEAMSPPQVAIREALNRAGTRGDNAVSSEIVSGTPVPVLLRQAEHASMVIVGDRGTGSFAALMLGSVALQLAAHAACPVLVARGQGVPDGPVVIGVDGSEAGKPAVEFAFAEAAARGVALIAIHTWVDLLVVGLSDMVLPDYDPDRIQVQEQTLLHESLSRWRGRYPGLTVDERVVRGRASNALVEASDQAQLVVVGARGGGGFPGLRLGSVTHALLHHSRCPVAVVHQHGQPAEA